MRRSLLLSVITAVLFPPLAAAAVGLSVMIDGRVAVFSDVPEDAWFSLYVKRAAGAGIVSGYKDAEGNLTGKFGPSNSVTIAQALKIAVEGAGYDPEPYVQLYGSNLNYVDHWVAPYLAVALQEMGAVEYVNQNQRNVDRIATRMEVVSMIAGAFKVDTNFDIPSKSPYSDVDVAHPNILSIVALTRDGIVSGDTDAAGNVTGRFRLGDAINRAETVKIVMRAREVYGEPGREEGSIIITYTNEGFSPSVLHVEKGSKVFFRNESSGQLWVASDPHPNHTDLEYFDAGRGHGGGETYEFDFLHPGSWGFHNHMSPQHRGTIIVK